MNKTASQDKNKVSLEVGLELEEDQVWDFLAQQREAQSAKYVPHAFSPVRSFMTKQKREFKIYPRESGGLFLAKKESSFKT